MKKFLVKLLIGAMLITPIASELHISQTHEVYAKEYTFNELSLTPLSYYCQYSQYSQFMNGIASLSTDYKNNTSQYLRTDGTVFSDDSSLLYTKFYTLC